MTQTNTRIPAITALTSDSAQQGNANAPTNPALSVLRQLPNVGPQIAQKLTRAGLWEFHQLATADPRWIESIAGRRAPFGMELKHAVDELPAFSVDVEVTQVDPTHWQAVARVHVRRGKDKTFAFLMLSVSNPNLKEPSQPQKKRKATKPKPKPKVADTKPKVEKAQARTGRILESQRICVTLPDHHVELRAHFGLADLRAWNLQPRNGKPAVIKVVGNAMSDQKIGVDARSVAEVTVRAEGPSGPPVNQVDRATLPTFNAGALKNQHGSSKEEISAADPALSDTGALFGDGDGMSDDDDFLQTSLADLVKNAAKSKDDSLRPEETALRMVQGKSQQLGVPSTPVTRLPARRPAGTRLQFGKPGAAVSRVRGKPSNKKPEQDSIGHALLATPAQRKNATRAGDDEPIFRPQAGAVRLDSPAPPQKNEVPHSFGSPPFSAHAGPKSTAESIRVLGNGTEPEPRKADEDDASGVGELDAFFDGIF
jgi:hypothetical protein